MVRCREGLLTFTLLLAASCDGTVTCEDGEELDATGACVPVTETDADTDSDTDADTDGPEQPVDNVSFLRLEWSTTVLPNRNVVRLACDGRRLMREDNFTYFAEHDRQFTVTPGEACEVVLEDTQGGLLPAGRLFVCSQEVLAWDAQRGFERALGPVETFRCVEGCTDPAAGNYVEAANLDDGTCEYVFGCTDARANNYDPNATRNDGTCDYGGFGRIELDVFTDQKPRETTVTVACNGGEALRIEPTASWATISASLDVQAGLDCRVVVSDRGGDQGAGGAVTVCGDVVASWPPTEGPGQRYEVEVGAFFVPPCSGCTNPDSPDYDATAIVPDGSCTFP